MVINPWFGCEFFVLFFFAENGASTSSWAGTSKRRSSRRRSSPRKPKRVTRFFMDPRVLMDPRAFHLGVGNYQKGNIPKVWYAPYQKGNMIKRGILEVCVFFWFVEGIYHYVDVFPKTWSKWGDAFKWLKFLQGAQAAVFLQACFWQTPHCAKQMGRAFEDQPTGRAAGLKKLAHPSFVFRAGDWDVHWGYGLWILTLFPTWTRRPKGAASTEKPPLGNQALGAYALGSQRFPATKLGAGLSRPMAKSFCLKESSAFSELFGFPGFLFL